MTVCSAMLDLHAQWCDNESVRTNVPASDDPSMTPVKFQEVKRLLCRCIVDAVNGTRAPQFLGNGRITLLVRNGVVVESVQFQDEVVPITP